MCEHCVRFQTFIQSGNRVDVARTHGEDFQCDWVAGRHISIFTKTENGSHILKSLKIKYQKILE